MQRLMFCHSSKNYWIFRIFTILKCYLEILTAWKLVILIKGYFRYKMITSENVSSQAQVQNFFYFTEKLCPVLKIFKFLYFQPPLIYQICDFVMNISTWGRVHFWIYLFNHNSLSNQTWPIDRYKRGQ